MSAPATSRPITSAARRRRPRRKPVKRSTIWLHRWVSLVLGLFLVAETSTGALLLYSSELHRVAHSGSYADVDADVTARVGYQQAIDAAVARHPAFVAGSVYQDDGTILVTDTDYAKVVTVDPRSGRVVGGWDNTKHSGFLAWVLAAAENIHECSLTCAGDPLYASWLTKEVPFSSWLGFEQDGHQTKITWAGLILGVLALMLVFLAVSGIWMWWPTIRHFKRGVRVRLKGNRYARDYDLHQVVGMIALPLLLVWGLTGMSYEFGFVEKGWYAALPGDKVADASLPSATRTGPEIGYDAALAAARRAAHTRSAPVFYEPPAPTDPTAPYSIWFSDGFDPWQGAGNSGGDQQVLVDRHDASRTAFSYGGPRWSAAQTIYRDWNYPVHAGIVVNGWWRILWLILGLTPLLLAWTGVSTWLFKRATRKRRRRAEAERAARPAPVDA